MGTARLRAHAKLTLSLRVLARRPDGYHDIEGLVASLADPADDVDVALRDDGQFTIVVEGQTDDVPSDETNLTLRAARVAATRLGRSDGVDVRLHKRIPAGAGLGGGSADAAASLHAVGELMGGDSGGLDLVAVASELGSDVPFCVTGGLAWMRGRGEEVERLMDVEGWWAVVAVPPFGLATPAVYAAWDELGRPRSDRAVAPPAVLVAVVDQLANDLEPAALVVEPRLPRFREALADVTGRAPLLAGSGSAYFVLFDDAEAAEDAARDARRGLAARVVVASGPATAGVMRRAG